MHISPEKMTFLTANYGLTPEQIRAFAEAYQSAYYAMAGEIEMSWDESGYYPDSPEEAMIECLVDADRLEPYIVDYMEWCFNFHMKLELMYDLKNLEPPKFCRDYLKGEDKTWWLAVR